MCRGGGWKYDELRDVSWVSGHKGRGDIFNERERMGVGVKGRSMPINVINAITFNMDLLVLIGSRYPLQKEGLRLLRVSSIS